MLVDKSKWKKQFNSECWYWQTNNGNLRGVLRVINKLDPCRTLPLSTYSVFTPCLPGQTPAFTNPLNRTWRAVCKCSLTTSSQIIQKIWQYDKTKLVEQNGRSFWPDSSRVKRKIWWRKMNTTYYHLSANWWVVKCSGTFSKCSKCFLTSVDSIPDVTYTDQLTVISW